MKKNKILLLLIFLFLIIAPAHTLFAGGPLCVERSCFDLLNNVPATNSQYIFFHANSFHAYRFTRTFLPESKTAANVKFWCQFNSGEHSLNKEDYCIYMKVFKNSEDAEYRLCNKENFKLSMVKPKDTLHVELVVFIRTATSGGQRFLTISLYAQQIYTSKETLSFTLKPQNDPPAQVSWEGNSGLPVTRLPYNTQQETSYFGPGISLKPTSSYKTDSIKLLAVDYKQPDHIEQFEIHKNDINNTLKARYNGGEHLFLALYRPHTKTIITSEFISGIIDYNKPESFTIYSQYRNHNVVTINFNATDLLSGFHHLNIHRFTPENNNQSSSCLDKTSTFYLSEDNTYCYIDTLPSDSVQLHKTYQYDLTPVDMAGNTGSPIHTNEFCYLQPPEMIKFYNKKVEQNGKVTYYIDPSSIPITIALPHNECIIDSVEFAVFSCFEDSIIRTGKAHINANQDSLFYNMQCDTYFLALLATVWNYNIGFSILKHG